MNSANEKEAASSEDATLTKKKEKPPLATVGQVFSFARTSNTYAQLIGAFGFAVLSGSTFPSELFLFPFSVTFLRVFPWDSPCTQFHFPDNQRMLLFFSTAMIFYFATAFEDLSASTDNEDFMDTVRSLVYAFLILGVLILLFMTIQNYLAESAAETMTHNLKTDWFQALLRQDMAYYDIRDVSGEATIISTNGNRYHRK